MSAVTVAKLTHISFFVSVVCGVWLGLKEEEDTQKNWESIFRRGILKSRYLSFLRSQGQNCS